MDKGKKVNVPVLMNCILLILRLLIVILICEVYKQNVAMVDRGYPTTENNYFCISVGWLPIILASVCIAANAVRLFLVCRHRQIAFKTDALSLIVEVVVAIVYTLPVLAATKDMPATAFKAVFITLCALLAAFTLFRGVFYITKTTVGERREKELNG